MGGLSAGPETSLSSPDLDSGDTSISFSVTVDITLHSDDCSRATPPVQGIQRTAKLADERTILRVECMHIGRRAHVQVASKVGLQVCLCHVDGSEIVITLGGEEDGQNGQSSV